MKGNALTRVHSVAPKSSIGSVHVAAWVGLNKCITQ